MYRSTLSGFDQDNIRACMCSLQHEKNSLIGAVCSRRQNTCSGGFTSIGLVFFTLKTKTVILIFSLFNDNELGGKTVLAHILREDDVDVFRSPR